MGTLVFQATLGGAVNIIGPNIASTINFTLPSADGSSGQTWTTNGSGVLAFGTLGIAGGGTGQITATAAFNALAPSQTGNSGKYLTTDGTNSSWATNPLGTVTSVAQSFTGGLISVAGSPITTSGTLALTVAGTSGGIPYFSSASTWATSAALAANALVVGGGAGSSPATVTTGTGVVTALGVNTGSAGAFVVNGGALGTPSSGTLTNCTGLPNAGLVNSSITIGGTAIALGASSNALANDITIYGVTVGRGGGAGSSNTAVGNSALNATATGYYLTAIGSRALNANTSGIENTGVGRDALLSNSTGNNNTAVGSQALSANTVSGNSAFGVNALLVNSTGTNNSAFSYALYSNTTGSNNTGLGYQALQANTTASNNTAVGNSAGYSNTTGANNTAIGGSALANNTTASSNTAVGYQAGYSNTTGQHNLFIGWSAGYAKTAASFNTAIGSQTLQINNGGQYCTAVGYGAGYASSGERITAIGNQALGSNTTASDNIAVGFQSAYSNTTGANNTALGTSALYFNTTASNNTAVGYQAGYTNQTGGGNTFLGYQAGYTSNATNPNGYNVAIGYNAGYYLTTGSGNTFVGNRYASGDGAGFSITTGSKNTIIGGYGGNQGSLDIRTASNYIVLSDGDGNPRFYGNNSGHFFINGPITDNAFLNIGADLSTSNCLALKDSGTTYSAGSTYQVFYNSANSVAGSIQHTASTVVVYGATSDERLKENIIDAPLALNKVMDIPVRSYDWKEDKHHVEYGFIAQELEKVYVEPVSVGGESEKDNPWGVEYGRLTPILVKAIQEQQAIIESLKARLDAANL